MADSWVFGNSWQLNDLTAEERRRMDEEPWVFVCNLFPSFWRLLNFRPTVWVFGDTKRRLTCGILSDQLTAIHGDEHLQERLKHRFICAESERAEKLLEACPIEHTLYRRGPARVRKQTKSDRLDGTIYHYASTLTDVVNLAWLLNPGQVVRLCGCQYSTSAGHFYDQPESEVTAEFQKFVTGLWEGLSDLRRQGINVIDCNLKHGSTIPDELRLPRELVFEASV